jgi:hypothetical protein
LNSPWRLLLAADAGAIREAETALRAMLVAPHFV